MKKFLLILVIISLFHLSADSFSKIESKDAAGEEMLFPEDLGGTDPVIFAFILGDSRESGTAQVEVMKEWEQAITSSLSVTTYHIPVIEGLPFFLKGIVRDGMRDRYDGVVDDERIITLFVKDMKEFIEKAGIPFSFEPTIVILDDSLSVRTYVKGSPTEGKITELKEALK